MSNKTIVVTRPSGQAQHLSEMLKSSLLTTGLDPADLPNIITLPLLTIIPKSYPALTEQIQASLKDADLIIFISPNAVECTIRLLDKPWQEIAPAALIGVMGGSSQLALHFHGIGTEGSYAQIILPQDKQDWDSEGLWHELQKLNWDWPAKKVLILKGEGGREWLADTLKNAGAQVEAIAVYARAPLDFESPAWHAIYEMDFSKSLWLLTSSEAVRHLGQAKLPLDTAMAICPHHNIADTAEQIGFGEVFNCAPGDEALIAASQAWFMMD
jgi:uroporphyrinogen-III synthase